MTTSRLPLFGLALALAATLALGAAPTSAPSDEVTLASATHTVTIQYLETRGLYRRAKVTIKPIRQGARAPWAGKLQRVYIAGLRPAPPRDEARAREAGFPRIAEFASSGHATGSNVYAPAPENLKRVWFRGERGSVASIRIWTGFHNPSTYGDDEEEPPKDPPTEDPPAEDPPEDDEPGGDDECGPIPAGCEIYNPWTCECDIGLEDPWGDEARTQGAETSFGF